MLAFAPAITLASYSSGGGSSVGSSLKRDICPNGDYSISYYDGTCDDDTEESEMSGVTLDGYIYYDDNENNFFDTDEDGVEGAIVTLKTVANDILDTDVTSAAGYYAFYSVQPGTYKVHVSIPARLTVLESILAVFAPAVNAQQDYEFTVVVEEGDTGTKTVAGTPVQNNGASSIADDDMVDEEEVDEDISNILDLIADATEDDAPTVTSSVNSGIDNMMLPTALPATGAWL